MFVQNTHTHIRIYINFFTFFIVHILCRSSHYYFTFFITHKYYLITKLVLEKFNEEKWMINKMYQQFERSERLLIETNDY